MYLVFKYICKKYLVFKYKKVFSAQLCELLETIHGTGERCLSSSPYFNKGYDWGAIFKMQFGTQQSNILADTIEKQRKFDIKNN